MVFDSIAILLSITSFLLIFLALLVVWLPLLALLMIIASIAVIAIDAIIAGTANIIAITVSAASVLSQYWLGIGLAAGWGGDGEHVCCFNNKKNQHY